MGSRARRAVIDASVWIAYFDKDDVHSTKAEAILDELQQAKIVLLLSDYTIQEILTVFLYKNKHQLVETFAQYIDEENLVQIVSIDATLLKKTIQLAKSYDWRPKLSLTDWSLLFLASNLGIPLYTFDVQLKNTYNKKR